MPAACIALVAGAAVVVLPTPTITLAWMHTVEKTRWEEDYQASTAGVAITEARIEAIGAGMEPPASAIREGRWWRYKPSLPVLPSVVLANSTFADGYSLCWSTECRPLAVIAPQGEQVAITASECTRAVPPTKMP
ncbi:MAG TPA: DUF1850 domain-containing protein [Thalassobaculum sp.]